MTALALFIPNIVNGVFLLVSIIFSFLILRAGVAHTMAYGDYEEQDKQKWVILRALVAMVVVGLVAVFFNIAQFFFEWTQ